MNAVINNKKLRFILIGLMAMVAVLVSIFLTLLKPSSKAAFLPNKRPAGMVEAAEEKDDFVDTPGRINKAFNAEDFGAQGNNGWLYKQGSPTEPQKAKKIKNFEDGKYFQYDISGLEVKKDFIHPGNGVAPILEWKVAQDGLIDIQVTYVKNVNGDKNPTFPDGVGLYVYHGDQLLLNKDAEVFTDRENIIELEQKNISVKKGESIYFVVDPKNNNAYDGGILYASIMDPRLESSSSNVDTKRKNNNANNIDDFGVQGKNGWYYQYGTSPEDARDVSTFKDDTYMHNTSPSLEIKKDFIHPGVNKGAILKWVAYDSSAVDLRLKYFKFSQNDGNPNWPDGVKIKIYRNNDLLAEKDVEVFRSGDNIFSYDLKQLSVNKDDKFYFIVLSRNNASYDGGRFEISIRDRSTIQNENSIVIPNDNLRTNNASVMKDFGTQGNNGWFYQFGTENDPFDAENISQYVENEKYYDNTGLEIKNNFIHPGTGRSAIVKWKVAQDGNIEIVSNYTKFPNNDPNPSWPDGTKVTLYHNSKALVTKDFKADRLKEIFADLSVKQVKVKKGDYITLVVNGKENNAWDAGSYTMTIKDLDNPLVENSISPNDSEENTAASISDFGKQGSNGWYYLQGTAPDNLKIVDEYDEEEGKYFSSSAPGLEIKKDFIHPSLQSGAAMQWITAKDGAIDILGEYVKFKQEDSNPNYPDGVTLAAYKNNELLLSKKVEVYGDKDNVIPVVLKGIEVKKDDRISFIITANDNTSYDGGRLNVNIQAEIKDGSGGDNGNNDSRKNTATLSTDFGAQGNNGWYYGYGTSGEDFEAALGYNANDKKYYQPGIDGLEIKPDFVHPGTDKGAIYSWTAGLDGSIDLIGKYVKFKHADANPSWPDGVTFKIYQNDQTLKEYKMLVSNQLDITQDIDIKKVYVKKGDKIYFVITANANNAWDGGRLEMNINPSDTTTEEPGEPGNPEEQPRENKANLATDFGIQGSNGWYYGYGTSNSDFIKAEGYNEGDKKYYQSGINGLELKPDFVQPGESKGAVYRWTVGEDGKIDLTGKYTKFTQHDGNPSWPDGVKLSIYHNNQVLQEDLIPVSDTLDNAKNIDIKALDVKKGDCIYFIITPNANNAWDGGRLEMSINPSDTTTGNPDDPGEQPRENKANLFSDFGIQGNNGWNFGYGTNSFDFTYADGYSEEEKKYFQAGLDGLELKPDFVQPAAYKGAVYRWTIGQDGKLDVIGKYTKFTHADGNPSWPDGVKLTIYYNGLLLQDNSIPVSSEMENVKDINIKQLEVKKGDKLYFIITANANNAWDGGKLEVSINPSQETPDQPPEQIRENKANIFSDFGIQGSNGWNYGYGTNSSDFIAADGYNAEEKKYYQAGLDGLELKPDFVQPAVNKGAVYKWTVGQDGKISLTGKYTKFTQHDGNPSWPDGIKLSIYHNNQVLQEDLIPVSDTVDNIKDIDVKSLDVKKGDCIYFIIAANANNAWDGGRLEVNINPVYDVLTLFPKSQQSLRSYIGDPMPYFDGTKFNIFYLDDRRDSNEVGFHPWSLITTDNFYSYRNEGVVINHSNNEADQDLALGTGSVIKGNDGLYHAFYTGFNDRRGVNTANLYSDFGVQGSNGWHYLQGSDINNLRELQDYNESEKRYLGDVPTQPWYPRLEIKPDFVQPGDINGAAMQWSVKNTGKVNIQGQYIKYGHQDGNPNWPDGTTISVYVNSNLIFTKIAEVKQGDGNNTIIPIALNNINVNANDKITFFVTAAGTGNGNNAWDGGKLEASVNSAEQPREAIMHAVSPDLKVWTKKPEDTFSASSQYSKDDFRDAYVMKDPADSSKYWMLITTRKDGKGAIARYTSTDLKTWTDEGVFFTNDTNDPGASLECPTLIKYGNYWYLTFSDQSALNPWGNRTVHYRMAQDPNSTFTKPGWDDTFDGNGFYAGRLEKDTNGQLYMFGWVPTKAGYNDSGAYDWGGNLVVHAIRQDANGKLYAVPVEAIENKMTYNIELNEQSMTNTIAKDNNKYNFSGNGYETVTFSNIEGVNKITGKINTADKNGRFGFMFNVQEDGKAPLNLVFNPELGRLEFHYSTTGTLSDATILATKPVSLKNRELNFTVLIDDSVAVLYVNNEAVLTTRMYGIQNQKWGIFSYDNNVTFDNVTLKK